MLEALGLDEAELSVLLCDDATIAELNHLWRGRRGPTDVLSFPVADGVGGPVRLLGDVVISVPTALRQAPRGKGGLRGEVTRLLAHAVLHLTGLDHATASERRAMDAETDRLVAAVTRRRRSAG
jgi:probable rRNA maturation factor